MPTLSVDFKANVESLVAAIKTVTTQINELRAAQDRANAAQNASKLAEKAAKAEKEVKKALEAVNNLNKAAEKKSAQPQTEAIQRKIGELNRAARKEAFDQLPVEDKLNQLYARREQIKRRLVLAEGNDRRTAPLKLGLMNVDKEISGLEALKGNFFSKAFGELKTEMPMLGRLARLALNPIELGFAAVVEGIKFAIEAVREFAQEQKSFIALDTALARNSLLTRNYREEIHKLAQEMGGKTAMKDTVWINAAATLTKYGAKSGNMSGLMQGVEDLAGQMGGTAEDVAEAANTIGLALNGITERLKIHGIVIDETWSKEKKLAEILKQAKALGGGDMENQAKGVGGQIQVASNAWEKFKSEVGEAIAAVLAFSTTAMAIEMFVGIVEKLSELFHFFFPENLVNKIYTMAQAEAAVSKTTQTLIDALGKENEKLEKQAELVEKLRKAHDELIEAKKASALAAVDQAEAEAPQTPENKAKFDLQRIQISGAADKELLAKHAGEIADDKKAAQKRVDEIKKEQSKLDDDTQYKMNQLGKNLKIAGIEDVNSGEELTPEKRARDEGFVQKDKENLQRRTLDGAPQAELDALKFMLEAHQAIVRAEELAIIQQKAYTEALAKGGQFAKVHLETLTQQKNKVEELALKEQAIAEQQKAQASKQTAETIEARRRQGQEIAKLMQIHPDNLIRVGIVRGRQADLTDKVARQIALAERQAKAADIAAGALVHGVPVTIH